MNLNRGQQQEPAESSPREAWALVGISALQGGEDVKTAFASMIFVFPIGCDTKRATWFDLVAAVFLLILLIIVAITIFSKVPLRSVILSFAASTYVMVSASLIACKKEKWVLIIHSPIMLYAVVMFYVNILRPWNLE